MSRPTIADLTGDHPLARIARETWLSPSQPPKVLSKPITEIWKIVEDDDFSPFSLLLLEQLQALERYLWPGYTDDAANQHVLLLALLINTKHREQLPVWSRFNAQPDEFASFFQRVCHLTIDPSLSIRLRTHLLDFLVGAFQSLDHATVRKECAPLVGIGIWHNLHSESVREEHVARSAQLQKAWRASSKKYDNADAPVQARLRFERNWLNTLLLEFLDKLYDDQAGADQKRDNSLYCERFIELLCDLLSQLPTRRYVNTLLQDLNILAAISLSPMYEDVETLHGFYDLLHHYAYFPVDDQTGRPLSRKDYADSQNAKIARLQKTALRLQPDKLKILALTNYGSLTQRAELLGHLDALTDSEVEELCRRMGIRTTQYGEKALVVQDRSFFVESLISAVAPKPYYAESMRDLPIFPTERTLYDSALLRMDEYDGSRPLAIPKLNLQYLTTGDFLWRSYVLSRHEAFYEIRTHIEDTIKRVQPRQQGTTVRFEGFSRMAIPIASPAIIETLPPRVGESAPAEVKVEVILDVSRLQSGVRTEWEALKPDDTVFLLAVRPESATTKLTNGSAKHSPTEQGGLKALRCAEVISVLDEQGRPLRQVPNGRDADDGARPRQRRLLLRMDTLAYRDDRKRTEADKSNVYDAINLIVRRKARENNFKPVLESVKQLALSDSPLPTWLQEVFWGYGDPSSATYKRLPNRLTSVDFRDTFLDWQHLIESLPGKTVEPDPSSDASFPPPYVLELTGTDTVPESRKGKKRRHDQLESTDSVSSMENFKVSTYQPPNAGPYLTDALKTNSVRFTPAQVEAITSGTQPGLTVIVGPPGTGKTDVATQIISNLYHNFPHQRTLLIAHSNQALNQLFEKIVALDIDERHLLRLGHGEEALHTEPSFSKAGRVDSFLERGGQYLAEVQRLSDSIGAIGAHGSSCETAEYFDQVYIQPRWKRFWEAVGGEDPSTNAIIAAFPFYVYFADAPQPLLSPDLPPSELLEVVRGCERHMRRIFDELADIRPFEILRSARDKSNYLLVKEARIVAMTSTHAAIQRQDIATLGFRYDNVVMEEAAQITDMESFIPLELQQPQRTGGAPATSPLQRIVLVGDHLQNAPVVQNAALKSYAHLDQSLFQRLIRLGVPHSVLDAQGRCRPSLAALFRWRYPSLTDLPVTATGPEFVRANAGFRYDAQFIDVGDYRGRGEAAPTPHFLQNLGEAEYAVALYQYMRLLGYPADKISILTAYAGQRALLRDVLAHRCKAHRLFGLPRWVGTVDQYQGEQNDYVILSLVRTKAPGYLRDLRRLTVALSRARLGLYVLGRKDVFESSLDLREAFAPLFARDTTLRVVPDELFPTSRRLDDDVPATAIEGVEHLGQYVFQMTQAKVQALKDGTALLPPPAAPADPDDSDDGGDGAPGDDDVEDEDA